MAFKDKVKGLVGLLGAGAVALGMSGDARGEQILTRIEGTGLGLPNMEISHRAGATEGYDTAYDSTFLQAPTPTIDFYSKVLFVPYQLKKDARPLDSFSTVIEEIAGRGLSNSVSGNLKFYRYDLFSDNAFDNKNIFADLYNSSHTLLGTYNVKDLASTGTTIPITVNNGLSYTMDVRFENVPEPSTLSLLAMAGIAGAGVAAYSATRNRKKE